MLGNQQRAISIHYCLRADQCYHVRRCFNQIKSNKSYRNPVWIKQYVIVTFANDKRRCQKRLNCLRLIFRQNSCHGVCVMVTCVFSLKLFWRFPYGDFFSLVTFSELLFRTPLKLSRGKGCSLLLHIFFINKYVCLFLTHSTHLRPMYLGLLCSIGSLRRVLLPGYTNFMNKQDLLPEGWR